MVPLTINLFPLLQFFRKKGLWAIKYSISFTKYSVLFSFSVYSICILFGIQDLHLLLKQCIWSFQHKKKAEKFCPDEYRYYSVYHTEYYLFVYYLLWSLRSLSKGTKYYLHLGLYCNTVFSKHKHFNQCLMYWFAVVVSCLGSEG